MDKREIRFDLSADALLDMAEAKLDEEDYIAALRLLHQSLEMYGPGADEYADLADSADIVRRIDASSSLTNPDIYYGIYTENGERRGIFFEVAEKTLKLLKYYNPDVVMTTTRR